MNAGDENDDCDNNSRDAFDSGAAGSEVVAFGEFFAGNNKKTGKRIDKAMDCVGSNRKRAGEETDDDAEQADKKIYGNKKITRRDNRVAAIGGL